MDSPFHIVGPVYTALRQDSRADPRRFRDVVSVDDKQQQMIDFERHWYPLGGGSTDEIGAQFGLTDRDFFAQVGRLVDDQPPSALTAAELRRMRGVIRRRLWMAR
ncbi:hypothetical protein GS4_33_00730 [Gordonia soli NBRC 108243]|uniref:DUF3263 domain-containing protein n=1 Tax=Gordonia soli NBRC 108243 TaxID=1223545 RepID=M0QNV6_9ACTN|nr:hypothetical protein GS4_33_00730 [Gordonia soli NBRC 108243]